MQKINPDVNFFDGSDCLCKLTKCSSDQISFPGLNNFSWKFFGSITFQGWKIVSAKSHCARRPLINVPLLKTSFAQKFVPENSPRKIYLRIFPPPVFSLDNFECSSERKLRAIITCSTTGNAVVLPLLNSRKGPLFYFWLFFFLRDT